MTNPESLRLQEANVSGIAWRKWGPYLSERQWGTVREDYSESGNAWDYFSHDQARSRAYRWGEDGIGGICDAKQQLCFALALWNGQDPILKERLFGLTNSEGNHGEDVKEYYFYLDSTPTHSYMKFLYKYPQAAFPYDDLVKTNRGRGKSDMEYELLDTGVFDEDRYFDVIVEYAKATPEDILVRITVHNRGPEAATLHLLPTLWFRNTWSCENASVRPELRKSPSPMAAIEATQPSLGTRYLFCAEQPELLFTENETNNERIFHTRNRTPYVKDAFNNFLVHGKRDAINPRSVGTKAAAHYELQVPAGGSCVTRLRLTDGNLSTFPNGDPFEREFEETFAARLREADEFYRAITPSSLDSDSALVMRQALAGMLWSKQFYFYDLDRWLEERNASPLRSPRRSARNDQWQHMYNADVISMPDKWEYPWYAAWDLAFHVLALSLVDEEFAKGQLSLMLREHYQHPNGQIPAYEWNFGDVNPPVHAWATIFTYYVLRPRNNPNDLPWLRNCFNKLLLNFTWWVNRKDRTGKNVFEGGFLGLDNIGVFDRSAPLPTGGSLEQADGTAWMALFCQNMLQITIELAREDSSYQEMALKFVEHFLWIASAMIHIGGHESMWDEADGFFYDVLRLPDGSAQRLNVRSMVGILPLCAVTTIAPDDIEHLQAVRQRFRWFLENRTELIAHIHDPRKPGHNGMLMLSIVDETKLRRALKIILDEKEFFSPFGIRSLSLHHRDQPFGLHVGDQEYRVEYLPAESNSGMFGGNSNWRGPIWVPVNALIVRALLNYYGYYGDYLRVECPTGSGKWMTLYEVAREITQRLASIFLRTKEGNRPVFGGTKKFQEDPHWKDCLQFFEYFHGNNGAGLGASHQTGWTGVIARLMHMFATTTAESALDHGRKAYFQGECTPEPARSSDL
jgi:hypothetical protein